jgi:hypothetical protein
MRHVPESNMFKIGIDAPKPPSGEIPNPKSQITNKEVPFGYNINASGDITCTCNLHLTSEKLMP